MKSLQLNGTEETPEIIFDKENKEFRIIGKSFMEDAASFYTPVIEWLKEYKNDPNPSTDFIFELEYLNTASTKLVHDLMDILDDIYQEGKKIKIIWYYYTEDEDMLELGKEYDEIYELPFEFKEIKLKRGNMFETD